MKYVHCCLVKYCSKCTAQWITSDTCWSTHVRATPLIVALVRDTALHYKLRRHLFEICFETNHCRYLYTWNGCCWFSLKLFKLCSGCREETRALQLLLEELVCKHFQALSVKTPPQQLSSILPSVVETHWWTKSQMHSLGLNECPVMHFLKIAKCWPLFKSHQHKKDLDLRAMVQLIWSQ